MKRDLHQLFHAMHPSLGEVLAKARQLSGEASLAPDEMTNVTILGDGKLTELFASELGLDFTGTKTINYPYTPTHHSETPCTSEITFQIFETAHDLPLPLDVLPNDLKANLDVDQYILATKETTLDELFVARTHYLTWISTQSRGNGTPIERMSLENNAITVIHLDESKVSKSLLLVSHLFELAVRCNYQKPMQPDLLRTCVAVFCYIFAHVVPDEKGNGHIGELIEAAIYDHNGYRSTLNDKVEEAVVSSLSCQQFLAQYDTLRVIEKLKAPAEAQTDTSAA